jgi:hypothetical protein
MDVTDAKPMDSKKHHNSVIADILWAVAFCTSKQTLCILLRGTLGQPIVREYARAHDRGGKTARAPSTLLCVAEENS